MCYAFSSSIPTVFLAECVLIYVDPKQTESMLEWIANRFETAMFINYQPVCCQQIHPSFEHDPVWNQFFKFLYFFESQDFFSLLYWYD